MGSRSDCYDTQSPRASSPLALHLSRLTAVIARAAQRYALVVRDQTRHAVSLFGETPHNSRAARTSVPQRRDGNRARFAASLRIDGFGHEPMLLGQEVSCQAFTAASAASERLEFPLRHSAEDEATFDIILFIAVIDVSMTTSHCCASSSRMRSTRSCTFRSSCTGQ